MARRILSPTKQKILILLGTGIALGFSGSPRRYFHVLKTAKRAWKSVDENYLRRTVREFHRDRLVQGVENEDGSMNFVITEKGKKRLLEFHINDIRIKKPIRWDGRWRAVMFDIPEKLRYKRNVLREKLKELKFYELQKSVFVQPYPCLDEINFIVEFYQIRKYVKCADMENVTNEAELRLHFKLK